MKVCIEGTYLNIMKTIYHKPTANIILNGEKLIDFPLKFGMRLRCPSHHFYASSIGSPSHGNQTRKRSIIGREEVKLSLYTDDTILYIEKPKDSTQKLLKLVVNKFTKVAGQKLTYRNQLHFFILIMKYQKWNVNNLFKITSKILVINLTKEVKDIY